MIEKQHVRIYYVAAKFNFINEKLAEYSHL